MTETSTIQQASQQLLCDKCLGKCTTNLDLSEEEGYISPYYCSSDEDLESPTRELLDEMPAFSTQSLSPSGRSLSPISLGVPSPPRGSSPSCPSCSSSAYSTPIESPVPPTGKDFVSLEEIHARIGITPPDSDGGRSRLNLETIFEDKFLETPPKKGTDSRKGQNLLRRSFRQRGLFDSTNGVTLSEPPKTKSRIDLADCLETNASRLSLE